MLITCKFGGTSLACSENIRRSCDVIKADSNRKFVVVSAPGKKDKNATKVTDLLLACYQKRFNEDEFNGLFAKIEETKMQKLQSELKLKELKAKNVKDAGCILQQLEKVQNTQHYVKDVETT